VGVEVLVLGRDHGLAEDDGRLLDRDVLSIDTGIERRQEVPVPVVQVGGLILLDFEVEG
jgi:hypothetical protein